MPTDLLISESVIQHLRCPRCHARLERRGQALTCTGRQCGQEYPLIERIPVLIDDRASVFAIADFVAGQETFFRYRRESGFLKFLRLLTGTPGRNIKGRANYARLRTELLKRQANPRVLVLGGSVLGQGMQTFAEDPAIELVESDVTFGPRTQMIFDAHEIPFEDGSFDGVIVQAVLEHVLDPVRCCAEIARVLKDGGLVYAETPFIQQVHGGRYDFTRFTHLGHRRLFRQFEQIDSGAMCGPGMALAWSYQYFLLSFTTWKPLRALLRIFANLTSFWLPFLDYLLIDHPGALDAASGVYFMGVKSGQILSDRDLVQQYRGAS